MGKRKKRRAKFVFMCANLVVVETDRVLACTNGSLVVDRPIHGIFSF